MLYGWLVPQTDAIPESLQFLIQIMLPGIDGR